MWLESLFPAGYRLFMWVCVQEKDIYCHNHLSWVRSQLMCLSGGSVHIVIFFPVSIGAPARLGPQNQIITSFLGKKVEYKHLLLFIYIFIFKLFVNLACYHNKEQKVNNFWSAFFFSFFVLLYIFTGTKNLHIQAIFWKEKEQNKTRSLLEKNHQELH